MKGGVSKEWTCRRSRVKLSKALQETLLDALESTGLPQGQRESSLQSGGFAGDPTPMQARKRRLDAITESDPLPAKRARLTQTDTQNPRIEDEESEQADKVSPTPSPMSGPRTNGELAQTALHQPQPRHSQYPYASFLKDFVDPVHPDPCPTSSVSTFVSQWLESVGSDRTTHCRSDSHLHCSDDDPIPRQLTKSEPRMGFTKDADGFTVPPTPGSTGPRSRRPSSDDNYSRFSATPVSGVYAPSSGVRRGSYRQNNLGLNHIYIQHPATPLPDIISSHIHDTLRMEGDSSELSSDELKKTLYRLDMLAAGCDESQVTAFLNDTIFPNPDNDPTNRFATAGLMSSSGALISQHLVPRNPASPYRVIQPKPDKLYGYRGDSHGAFTEPQLLS